jgi:hypothetical protein
MPIDTLARHVERTLQSQSSALVVQEVLQFCWPFPKDVQMAEIDAFALQHGWRVEISEPYDMGLVAEFFPKLEMSPAFSPDKVSAGTTPLSVSIEALHEECQRLRAEADRLEQYARKLEAGIHQPGESTSTREYQRGSPSQVPLG